MKVVKADIVAIILVLALAVSVLAQKQQAPSSKGRSNQTLSARQIARMLFPSVVVLLTKDANGKALSLGSGFFVQNDVIATAYHVIKGAAGIYVRPIGSRSVFEVVGIVAIDEKKDLALLKVEGLRARPLVLGNMSQIEVGDQIYALGNPEGLEGTFSQGIVSAIRGSAYIQITASISHGSSGGPIINVMGEVVGIAVGAIEDGQNLNFAIPATHLYSLIRTPTISSSVPAGNLSHNEDDGKKALLTPAPVAKC